MQTAKTRLWEAEKWFSFNKSNITPKKVNGRGWSPIYQKTINGHTNWALGMERICIPLQVRLFSLRKGKGTWGNVSNDWLAGLLIFQLQYIMGFFVSTKTDLFTNEICSLGFSWKIMVAREGEYRWYKTGQVLITEAGWQGHGSHYSTCAYVWDFV